MNYPNSFIAAGYEYADIEFCFCSDFQKEIFKENLTYPLQ